SRMLKRPLSAFCVLLAIFIPAAARAAPIVGPAVGVDAPVDLPTGRGALGPSVAFDGTGYLTVWAEARQYSSAQSVYGARLDRTGKTLDPRGFHIADDLRVAPTVSYGGGTYL